MMMQHRELEPLLNWTNSSYVPEEYEVPSTIEQTHNQPRYGKTNDFGALIAQNSEETAQDYILGIVIGAMIILIVALLWFFVIIVLKFLGQKKVGFFAGRLVRPVDANLTAKKQEEDINENKDTQPLTEVNEAVPVSSPSATQYRDANTNEKFKQRVWAVRLMFVLSGCFVIIAGGLFYGKGVVSFKNSIDEVRNGISLVQDAARKGVDLTENLLLDREEIVEEVETTEEVKDENEGEICGLDSETSNQIRLAYDEFTTNVDELTDMLDGTLEGFSDDLRSLISLTQNIDDSLDTADIFFYILIAISVVIICIVAAMLAAVFFAIKGWENTFTRIIKGALLWPFFIFFLLLSWIFATLFLVFSLAGADFCVDPDGYVQVLLEQSEDMFEGLIFGFIVYYVSGCQVEPAGVAEIRELSDVAQTVVQSAHGLTSAFGDASVQALAAICGLTIKQATALRGLINVGHDTTHLINRGVIGLRSLLHCETFNPIYNTFVHQAFCVQGVSGLTYIFSTTLVIAICSMLMIMFRATMYPIKEPSDDLKLESEDGGPAPPAAEEEEEEKPVIY